jgi:outer membrane protein insertion porin family
MRDHRDSPIEPTRGSWRTLTAEIAGGPLQGSSSFTKLQGVASWYVPAGNSVFAARIAAGLIGPFGTARPFSPDSLLDPDVARVPLEDRFRIGGVNSLRGYDENEVPPSGGLAMLQANAELRVPLKGPLGFEVFLDAGNVWTRPEYLKGGGLLPEVSDEPMSPNDVRWVAGLGPRLLLPFGALRLDFTWAARPDERGRRPKGRAQFAIGPAF